MSCACPSCVDARRYRALRPYLRVTLTLIGGSAGDKVGYALCADGPQRIYPEREPKPTVEEFLDRINLTREKNP